MKNSSNLTCKVVTNNNVQSTKNNNNHLAIQHQQQQAAVRSLVNHQQVFNNFVAGHQPPNSNNNNYRSQDFISNNMPKNEPVKLVYPTTQTSSSTIVTMNNNRVTFTSAPIQNGTVTLSPMTANSMNQPNQQQQATIMQRTAGGQQAPTLIFKNTNSSTPGTLITSSPVTTSRANSQVSENSIKRSTHIYQQRGVVCIYICFMALTLKHVQHRERKEKMQKVSRQIFYVYFRFFFHPIKCLNLLFNFYFLFFLANIKHCGIAKQSFG